MKRYALTALSLLAGLALAASVAAHCQIPCGIYDDELRVQLIEEHITTVEKSMKQVVALGNADATDYNQLVRWVGNKEEHAQAIQDIVTAYFMAQRIKPASEQSKAAHARYVKELTLLHQLLVTTMKAKQSTDLQQVEKAQALLAAFRKSYLGDKAHTH